MRTETQGIFCALNAIVAYLQVLQSVSVVYVGIPAAMVVDGICFNKCSEKNIEIIVTLWYY